LSYRQFTVNCDVGMPAYSNAGSSVRWH